MGNVTLIEHQRLTVTLQGTISEEHLSQLTAFDNLNYYMQCNTDISGTVNFEIYEMTQISNVSKNEAFNIIFTYLCPSKRTQKIPLTAG